MLSAGLSLQFGLPDSVSVRHTIDTERQVLTRVVSDVTGILELLPGGTLTGLAKRALKGTPTLAVKSPDDLEKARAFITEHATPVAD